MLDNILDKSGSLNSHRRNKEGDNMNKGRGMQCHEYEGFVHIPAECTNFLRNKKKVYTATLSDEEYEEESDEEMENFVIVSVFTLVIKQMIK